MSVQSDSWLGHQGAKTENTKSAIIPEVFLYTFRMGEGPTKKSTLVQILTIVNNPQQHYLNHEYIIFMLELIKILVCQ
jgi:hypothetical protein